MEIECRHFNGYKPCGKNVRCERSSDYCCPYYQKVGARLLIVHLEALGAVLRSTSLLKPLRRLYPDAHITWVTKAPAQALLANLKDIDRVLTTHPDDLLKLKALSFDKGFVLDKSLVAAGILQHTQVERVFGFKAHPANGALVPANPEATELWQLGLSDHAKFFVNQKSEQQLSHDALALGPYSRDRYQVAFDLEEQAMVARKRREWGPGPILGINTGCSDQLPAKKLSHENHRQLIGRILDHPRLGHARVVLLGGGSEDRSRNAALVKEFPTLIGSPTDLGLRDGMTSVAACDLIFSGDSLGLHMAIALEKYVVAWFGPTVAAEIDLYERGQKIVTAAACSPCWKRVCHQPKMCYDQLDLARVISALNEGLNWLTLSSKPHSPETSSSRSL